jgi:hypothetical protein
MKMENDIVEKLDDKLIGGIADAIYAKIVGANFNLIEHDLRLRLALEQHLTGSGAVPFGLDRMTTVDTAAYLGLQAETLRSTAKRRLLRLPEPYNYGKKLFWRRSELDDWVERQRREPRPDAHDSESYLGDEGRNGERA